MYRYTTRNVHLYGQLSLYLYKDPPTFSTATYILRRTSTLAPPSYPLTPTQSTVNHANAPALGCCLVSLVKSDPIRNYYYSYYYYSYYYYYYYYYRQLYDLECISIVCLLSLFFFQKFQNI